MMTHLDSCIAALKSIDSCAAVSADQQHVCILDKGHPGDDHNQTHVATLIVGEDES